MRKSASSGANNSVTQLPIPFIGDINNRRFVTAVLAGVLGGAGVSAAANLLRSYREMRKPKSDETDDETIVLTLPKAAADGYTGMRDAKPGESKITANGSKQYRAGGKYGARIAPAACKKETVKVADDGNPGPHSVGTMVANALGLTAGGLLSYEVVSRMFDALQERRLKKKLQAAQQAYVDAMAGASKRAEAVMSVIGPADRVFNKGQTKSAGILDIFPDSVSNTVRYPMAAYILALLAGTGATAYVTKKVMDREFPEEKLKKDINMPTRIVFRTAGASPSLLEGKKGKEKQASAETCAALTAMLPVYMDIVEGKPNRTLAEPYVKIAAAAGTDSAGLMKLAQESPQSVAGVIMSDPKAVLAILKGTNFGLSFSKLRAANALRDERPDTYRKAVDAAIDARFANGPNDGLARKAWNSIARASTKAVAAMGGRDMLVNHALKSASVMDIIGSDTVRSALSGSDDLADAANAVPSVDEDAVLVTVSKKLKGKKRRRVSVEASDPGAAAYIKANKDRISRLMERLNARGLI